MLLLSCCDLQKSFAHIEVLKKVSFDVQEGERLGIVGPNGAGKTTVANLIFGELTPDSGTILQYRTEITMGFVMQSKAIAFRNIVKEGESNQFLTITKGLGLKKVQEWEEERYQGLSGGERTKLALAEVWAKRPELLILDEPTNHLDFQGVEWLIKELTRYKGTILIISHDRYFLDRVANRIVELENGEAKSYAGNYTFYREVKERQRAIQLQQYYTQMKQEMKIEDEINRLKMWSAKAHREAGKVGKMVEMRKGGKEFYRSKAKKMDQTVKSRIHRLEKMRTEGVEKPKDEQMVNFAFTNAEKHGKRILEARRIKKSFGERVLFQDSSFYILRGERVGFLGPNGCGKTTLIKLILGEETLDEGRIWLSPSARVGYLSQDVSELDPEKTILQTLGLEGFTFIDSARTILANMGFDDDKFAKQIKELSMGERLRVKLANLIMNKADLLILDEPTNHLDLQSREELEEALNTYDGTLIIVSHDRYMLEKLCNRLLVFEGQNIRKVLGSYTIYEERKREQARRDMAELKAKMMVMENRLTIVLSRFSRLSPEEEEYQELDVEYQELVRQKRELINLLKGGQSMSVRS